MRVIIADDHKEVRSAIRLLLSEKAGFIIAGEAVDADELITRVTSGFPDLVILDWDLPGRIATELLPLLFKLHPRLAVVVLSCRPQLRPGAINLGAKAFVCKSDPPEALLKALERCRDDSVPRS
jgi:DNA-binding NarL/FixJ family response regulator